MANELGYYSDKVGDKDTYTCPGDRCGEKCLNCDQPQGFHYGWACDGNSPTKDFDELPWEKRYVTASMRKSRNLGLKGAFAHKYDASGQVKLEHADVTDWRTWARVKPGECACAIPRHQCKYHGNAEV